MSRQITNSMARGRGFSLVEVLISIGVLGIGLSMVMLIFPAAVVENRSSANTTIGGIMCENAIATAKVILVHDPGFSTVLVPTGVSEEDLKYPAQADNPLRSVFLMARQERDPAKPLDPVNDYVFLAVAVKRAKDTNTIQLKDFTGTLAKDTDEESERFGKYVNLTPSNGLKLELGCTVIADNGRFSNVVATREGNVYVLRNELRGESDSDPSKYFVPLENDGSGEEPTEAMNALMIRTPLREQ
jgi:prepilin-type N-terminal cleavage/methylation domain-containing protein